MLQYLSKILLKIKLVIILSLLLDKYVAYNHGIFYIASSKQIKLYSIEHKLGAGEQQRVKPDESEIATIKPDNQKIHGLFVNKDGFGTQNFIFVALETDDN